MNELDAVWAQTMNAALARAQAADNRPVADYLTLRAANDLIRRTSVQWLFDSLAEIASFANRRGDSVICEVKDAHQFTFANANLVGSSASFRQGVRCLTLEAGWTRTPGDGFMRGGALAVARILHFGLSEHNAELLLIVENDSPNWFSIDKNGGRANFDSKNLNEHFQIFLG